jgi:ankyrin repeat protein
MPDSRPKPRAMVEAGRQGAKAALEALLAQGGDLNASYANYRPLHALIQTDPHKAHGKPSADRLRCLQWLLANGADPELTGGWPPARAMVIAGFTGISEYVGELRTAGVKIDGFAAAALGDVSVVKRALRADPAFASARDSGGLTALVCAAGSRMPGGERASVEIATMLLDAGADPRATIQASNHVLDATYFATAAKREGVFRLILERGGNATEALSHAVWANLYDLAEIALRHGAEPDRATANGKPLLNDLIRWGRMEGTNWLLAHGASPNIPDRDGWTAVHQAASRGNARLLQAALRAGGDPARKDKLGHTPLDVARITRRVKLVPLLA